MSEENSLTTEQENAQQPQSSTGIKGFFKKVKNALEKFDKKMEQVMDNDGLIPPPLGESKTEVEQSNQDKQTNKDE